MKTSEEGCGTYIGARGVDLNRSCRSIRRLNEVSRRDKIGLFISVESGSMGRGKRKERGGVARVAHSARRDGIREVRRPGLARRGVGAPGRPLLPFGQRAEEEGR